MRFQGEHRRGRLVRACLLLTSTTALAACGTVGSAPPSAMANPLPVNGPQADYPVLIGEPYELAGTTYRPADVLNYDEVGYLTAGSGAGVTGAHHTLPVPSYVEVTSLESGRTILVRLEQRGPMDSGHLVALSPAAMAQLEATPDTPVRVRRVNPPEAHRALLRAGEAAPQRMDTPQSLVQVLRRRLPAEGSASLAAHVSMAAAPEPDGEAATVPAVEVVAIAPSTASPAPELSAPLMAPAAEPETTPGSFAEAFSGDEIPAVAEETAELAAAVVEPAIAEAEIPAATLPPVTRLETGFVVQAGAFSVAANAERVASQIGGQVSQRGALHLVRTGPFATRAEAEASLANVRAAGYSDARIYTTG